MSDFGWLETLITPKVKWDKRDLPQTTDNVKQKVSSKLIQEIWSKPHLEIWWFPIAFLCLDKYFTIQYKIHLFFPTIIFKENLNQSFTSQIVTKIGVFCLKQEVYL